VPANTRRSLAKVPHDRDLRLAAKRELVRPAVRFNDAQMACIAGGIGDDVRKYALPCYAAAIMPDHVHMVIARQARLAEQWVGYFKRAAARPLRKAGLHPFGDEVDANDRVPTPWCEGGWKVYLHDAEEILRCVRYTEMNPEEAGLPAQHWEFVTRFLA
jgi:REP element-mobilizing transposase RayT